MRKPFEHLVFAGAAADVEEIGRLAAVVLDQVHRAHRQPRPIDQAGDVAVQVHEAQAALAGPQLGRIFFGRVEQGGDVGVAEQGVVVEIELAIERQHVAAGRDDQRVDLGERGVGVDEELDEVLEKRRPFLGRIAGEAERLADLPRLEIGQAEADVDRHAEDLFGGVVRDDLDIDSAFGRGHHDRALQAAVDRQPQVELAGDVVPDRDQHLGDRAPLRHRSGR